MKENNNVYIKKRYYNCAILTVSRFWKLQEKLNFIHVALRLNFVLPITLIILQDFGKKW